MINKNDNIHVGIEKLAGLPGYMKKQLKPGTLKKLRSGAAPYNLGDAGLDSLMKGEASSKRILAYIRGREGSKHWAKMRKTTGQERAMNKGNALAKMESGQMHKRLFRDLVPKPSNVVTGTKTTQKWVPTKPSHIRPQFRD